MKLIPGNELTFAIDNEVRSMINSLVFKPSLAIIKTVQDEPTNKFVELKIKKANELGITIDLHDFAEGTVEYVEVIETIRMLNLAGSTNGVMVQLPVASRFAQYKAEMLNQIKLEKDVDALSANNQGRAAQGVFPYFISPVVFAILHCIEYTLTNIQGKHILIINDSHLVGRPLAQQLLDRKGTVTLANKFTSNLSELSLRADIIVSATGVPGTINGKMVGEGAIVIDAGYSIVGGKVLGDVDADQELQSKVAWLTPSTGCVGPLTISYLMRNVAHAAKSYAP